MKNTNVIEVSNVSKAFSKNYKSERQQLKKMLFENYFGCKENSALSKGEFWALKNISFSVKKNEKLAILGPNGSGKSTLLKMLNGIYMPDEGEIKVDGLISSVLELSTGFNAELSGRDNIYLKFSLQGRRKEEIDAIIDEVIAFSELEEFMDTPLKHYSSGMKSKLGFAIVSNMDPEILILDEVFAAGDQKFRAKSEARIKELYQNTTTILVTHSMGIVHDVADRVIVLNKGELVFDGSSEEGIEFYERMNDSSLPKIYAFVERLYKEVLGREGKEAGLNYWAEELRSKQFSGSDLAREFILSGEFRDRYTDNITFIVMLYKVFYDRKAEQAELNLNLAQLDEGVMREDILETFLNSNDFSNLCKTYGINALS